MWLNMKHGAVGSEEPPTAVSPDQFEAALGSRDV